MKILLTRHGETEENRLGILQGWKPGHLSLNGIEQARLLAERLKDIKIDVIITSDLLRCVDTAKEIAKYHKEAKFIEEKSIRERNLGVFEGKVVNDSDWNALPGDEYTNRPDGGETFVEVWERISKLYNNLLKNYNQKTILIVGHGGSQKLLQGLIQKIEFKRALDEQHLENTAISEFEVDKKGNFKTIAINCKKHLME